MGGGQDWLALGGGTGLLERRDGAEWVGKTLDGYRLCLLGDTHLATVPHVTQESDVLCLVLGNRHPCVLREKRKPGSGGTDERTWSVIGGKCQVWDPDDPGDDGGDVLWGRFFDDELRHGRTGEWDNLKEELGDPEVFLLE
jgi:hypothetical protein